MVRAKAWIVPSFRRTRSTRCPRGGAEVLDVRAEQTERAQSLEREAPVFRLLLSQEGMIMTVIIPSHVGAVADGVQCY